MKPLVLFYHLFAVNDWEAIVSEQFSSLLSSGLSRVAQLNVCISGPEKSESKIVLEKFSSDFLNCKFHIFDENRFEWPTLQMLWNLAKEDNAYYLYFHAKGVTQSGEKRPHVDMWRKYLNYFCITQWRDCVASLETSVDLAGCQYMPQTKYYPCHYSGNFWWAASEYIKRLPDPASFNGNRLEAEFWSCRSSHRALSLWSTNVCMYNNSIMPESYTDKANEPIVYVYNS